MYGVPVPDEIESIGEWIFASPERCPSKRLRYEVYHATRKNIGYVPEDSDIDDFSHLECLPYVDLMTLDRDKADKVRQASKVTGYPYSDKVCINVDDILKRL